jgi:metallo-beta-lactamase class B
VSNILRLLPLVLAVLTYSAPAMPHDETAAPIDPARLGNDPAYFLAFARSVAKWDEQVEPFHIGGPVYYVGTKGLGVYLLQDNQGLILLNTAMPRSGKGTLDAVRKLGFDPSRIRYIALSHAHIDHVGDLDFIRRTTGAKIVVLDKERSLLESGGKDDFHYGETPEMGFTPVKADRVFRDGQTLRLGKLRLQALATPGHTKGSTTWLMTAREEGQTLTIVWPDGVGINPGYRLKEMPSYLGIAEDYRLSLDKLSRLNPDIWLPLHPDAAFWQRAAGPTADSLLSWVDREGYKAYLEAQRKTITVAP